jgi:hypothetical protein
VRYAFQTQAQLPEIANLPIFFQTPCLDTDNYQVAVSDELQVLLVQSSELR